MDEKAKDKVIEEINPQKGIKSELNRVLSKNDSLRSSSSWTGATSKQERAIRSRITSTRSREGLKFEENGKTFIRVDKDNYRRVTSNEDVYIDERTDTVWLRDEDGRFKEVVK